MVSRFQPNYYYAYLRKKQSRFGATCWSSNPRGDRIPYSNPASPLGEDDSRQLLAVQVLRLPKEEHALARGGLRYFGGFALKGKDVTGDDRRIVLGLRNAHDKSFAASIAAGNQMMVCENLCFSSDVKLARRHTTHIFWVTFPVF